VIHKGEGGSKVAIAENVKHHRTLNEMSQMKLSELSGVSQAQISHIESGEKKNPGVITIKKLADALNVGVEELIK
jgi:transcriptional regulator with XRE-family HTH domain